jgi:hypothetical protein
VAVGGEGRRGRKKGVEVRDRSKRRWKEEEGGACLDPWRRNAMIVEVSGKAMVNYLLQNRDEARDEIFERGWRVRDHSLEQRQSGTHHAGIFIAESPSDLDKVIDNTALVHLVQSSKVIAF